MNKNSFNRLVNKVAVVTGSTRGIGRAIAIAYAREGAKVVITGRNKELCDETISKIKTEGGDAIGVLCDITKQEDIDRLFDTTLKKYGRLDISVQNAGIAIPKPFLEMDRETLSKIWDTNMYGTYFCAQRAAEIMVKQGGGKIINMASILSESGKVGLSGYAPTKAAISLITKCMALELAQYKINVNAIGPGTIMTDIAEMTDEVIAKETAMIPLGIGEPEDICGIAILLASSESDYMTGHTVFVDGGYNIK